MKHKVVTKYTLYCHTCKKTIAETSDSLAAILIRHDHEKK